MNFTVVLLIMTGIISYQAFSNPAMRQKLLFYPTAIQGQGEWYRFISSGFVHADWGHLIVNMYVLYLFGSTVEAYFGQIFGPGPGRIIFILFYVSAIAVANIPSYFRHKDNAYYRALGASGATSALVFIYVVFQPLKWFLYPPQPAIFFGIVYLLHSSYMDKKGMDNIGHNAHFWGAVYGLAFIVSVAMLYEPRLLNIFIERLLSPQGPPFF